MNNGGDTSGDQRTQGEQVTGTRVGSGTVLPVFQNSESDKQGIGNLYQTPPAAGTPLAAPAKPPGVADIGGLPEVEDTPDFLGFEAEPWAAVVPMRGRTRLVHLSLAPDVRSNLPQKRGVPGKPIPFHLDDGREVSFLPPPGAPVVTPADLTPEARTCVLGDVDLAIKECGVERFLLQVEQARAYLRGPHFWRLRNSHNLRYSQRAEDPPGYQAVWLAGQASKQSQGRISWTAMAVAARLDGLLVQVFPLGAGAFILR